MATEQGGVWGDWGPDLWANGDATVLPNGPQVQSNSVLVQSTEATGSDKWTGFLQTIVGNTLEYAKQRDAAKAGLTQARAANGAPVYVPASAIGPTGISQGGLIVIAAAIVGGLILAHKG